MASPPHPPEPPWLETLLELLRRRGLTVTAEDYHRLARVFPAGRGFDREDTRELLVALLAKNQRQRQTVRRVFESLLPPETSEQSARGSDPNHRSTGPPTRRPPGGTARRKRRNRFPDVLRGWSLWRVGLATALLVLAGISVFVARGFLFGDTVIETPRVPGDIPAQPPPETPPPGELPDQPVPVFHTWVPILEVEEITPLGWLGPPLALFFGGVLGVAWLGQEARERTRLDFEPLEVAPEGIEDFDWPLPPRASGLLDGQARREMVWGVTRYQSAQALPRLDIPRTVAATARAGLPEIRFAHATHAREVWLWQDVLADSPEIRTLSREIERTLTRAGLTVRLGRYRGMPYRVQLERGETLEPADLEGETREALLALLTDGVALSRALERERPDALQRALRVLRDLREWPRLCIVDFSSNDIALCALARRHGLTCLPPRELAYWLAERSGEGADGHRDYDPEMALWGATCALLPDRSVTETEARALHDALGLNRTWRYSELRNHARGAGTGLAFGESDRRRLLRDLAQEAWRYPATRKRLDQALEFWLDRLERTADSMPREAKLRDKDWHDSPGEHGLRLEELMLELWRAPEPATQGLYDLYQHPEFQADIRRRMTPLAARGMKRSEEGVGRIVLPWDWGGLSRPAQARLLAMGFAGARKTRLALTPFPRFALGLLAGVATVGLLVTGNRLVGDDLDLVFDDPAYETSPFRSQVIDPVERHGRLHMASRKLATAVPVTPHGRVRVHWCWSGLGQAQAAPACHGLYEDPKDPRNNNVVVMGDSRLLRAGALAEPIRACAQDWPELSVAVIVGDWSDPDARRLAIRLLDKGSADLALIGRDWARQARTLGTRWRFVDDSQWLFFFSAGDAVPGKLPVLGRHRASLTGDFLDMAKDLDFEGAAPAKGALQHADRVQVLAGTPRLWGGPQIETHHGIEYVAVCPGTFTMGSGPQDRDAAADERPAHPVLLEGFHMARSETTREQLATARPDLKSGGGRSLPAVDIDWKGAGQACNALEARLPTEAEWEYVARAGAQTPWYWGASATDAGRFSWYGGNSNRQLHAVRTREPNALGLYDMAGNVWEWVQDCYDAQAYARRGPTPAHPSPVQHPECRWRVLRGGSFGVVPWGLRSADRSRRRGVPLDWRAGTGFRCVRGSGRQSNN